MLHATWCEGTAQLSRLVELKSHLFEFYWLNGMDMSHDHLDWPRLSYREQFKEGDEEADRGNDGKTTLKSGLALNGTSYCGKLRTARKLVVKSAVVPQRLARLRDRYEEDKRCLLWLVRSKYFTPSQPVRLPQGGSVSIATPFRFNPFCEGHSNGYTARRLAL